MSYWRVTAVSPDDGVEFLDWKTKADTSQDALRGFVSMIDEALDGEFQLKGDFDVRIREVEREEIPFPEDKAA